MSLDLEKFRDGELNRNGLAVYHMDVDDLGDIPLADAVKELQVILAIDPEARFDVEHDYDMGTRVAIKWVRELRPEEIAKIDRDKREAQAKRATAQFEEGRRQFEALKKIYEPEKS